jgi:formate dehydrogenase subunit gamma
MRMLLQRGARALAVLWLVAGAGATLAQQSPATPAGPPPGFVAPAEPKPDESNAQRDKTQPGNNAPFWRAARESGAQQGVVNMPGAELGTLIQSFVQYPGSRLTTAGEAWRQVRNNWLIPYGGSLLLIALVAVGLYYKVKGPMRVHAAATGRVIERFTPFERAAHWVNAIAFVVLAVSGIVMAFGKFFLLPVLGSTLFGWLTYALKNLHNFAGPLFAVSLLIVFLTFLKDNLPRAGDLAWLAKGGGMFSGEHVPSHRFNAGEKVLFWVGIFSLGVVTLLSGLFLNHLLPVAEYSRGNMQIANMVHLVSSSMMMALFIGHIYMGSIGVEGAYGAMRTGYVDEAWAKEHHEHWYDDVKAGRIPAQRSAAVAPHGDAAGAGA